ncbi:IS1595 family transposase [Loktanella sp. DJP18]|uniref:IS1595 family transposase n=1 Tax=Loktanella sp. DJP18 TaxID=3409788 RepID=UPI003BB4BCC7
MKPHDFRRLIKHLDDLSPAQVQDASRRITEVRRKTEAITEIEARAQATSKCPHCRHGEREKWGRTRTNIQRYRCRGCRRTYTGRTGSTIQHLHRPDLFLEVAKDMLGDRAPSSIRELSRSLRRNKHTIWRWRMIILNALSGASSNSFGGIVEADETYQRESRKGSREWVRHLRNPSQHPKPPRRRWYEYGEKGIPMMRGLSRWQLPILTVADRGGARRFQRIAGRSNGTIQMALSPIVARDAVLCTDGLAGYAAFAQSSGIEHFVIKTKPGQKAVSATHHIQNINSLHSRYKDFTRPFRGPASKYLGGYLQWFIARVGKIRPDEILRTV